MSATVGAGPSCSDMGSDENKQEGENSANTTRPEDSEDESAGGGGGPRGESSRHAAEEDDDEDHGNKLQVGPQYTLKEQIEMDKSLRKWKEQLLGSVDLNNIGETLDPEVKITRLEILSPGRADIVLPIPEDGKPQDLWFVLKEGSKYNLKFTFQVGNNIVSGLKYTNTVWKAGIKVETKKEMLGTFSPQAESYAHVMPEETTPSGFLARGTYTAKSKFLDDDNKCYLEINYTFEIKKEWSTTSS